MAIKKEIKHRVDIPHEPGQWMEFRELGWGVLDDLRTEKMKSSVELYKQFGSKFIEEMEAEEEKKRAAAEARGEEYKTGSDEYQSEFDKRGLLRHCIVAWSYPDPVSPENIEDLDVKTANWAYQTASELHIPTKDELGNSSSASNDTFEAQDQPPAS